MRNWDYRYCWLRDATVALYGPMLGGYFSEAAAWRTGSCGRGRRPSDLEIVYGPAGERRLPELQLDWPPGYAGSRPVRVGNAATGEFQLDAYGEVLDCFHQARLPASRPTTPHGPCSGHCSSPSKSAWREPDEGIWEVRGPRRHFTHSKVMAWAGLDRAVKAVERSGREGPVAVWVKVFRSAS